MRVASGWCFPHRKTTWLCSRRFRRPRSKRSKRAWRWCRENLIKLEGSQARGMLKLTDVLDNHDDVQNVYSNFDIDEEELAAMEQ
jgi:transcriptional/translational regulatory protein YebC/TACO1